MVGEPCRDTVQEAWFRSKKELVSARATVVRIGQRSILVAVLMAAAVVGFGVGTWLGHQSVGSPPQAGPSVSAVPSAPPSATASPAASATASPATASPAPAAPRTVLEIYGVGDLVSQSFTVRNAWQVNWRTDGGSFAFAIRGDQDLGTVVDQPGPASGVISPVPLGTFHIEVTAEGPWSIIVVEGG